MATLTTDEQARRLVVAVSGSARCDPTAAMMGPRAVTDLYQRIRERLTELGVAPLEDLADDLALTIYLAWLAEDQPLDPNLLVTLRSAVEVALKEPI